MHTSPETMSQNPLVDGQSPRGLINGKEAMKALKRGVVAGGVVYALTVAGIEILASFGDWYNGPVKAELAGIVGMIVMYLRARNTARKMLGEGDEE
jgi:hypothetical protein